MLARFANRRQGRGRASPFLFSKLYLTASIYFFFFIMNTDKNYTHLCRPVSNAANNANVIIFFCLDSILPVNLPRMLHVK